MSAFSTGLEPGISGVKRTNSGAVKKPPVDSVGNVIKAYRYLAIIGISFGGRAIIM